MSEDTTPVAIGTVRGVRSWHIEGASLWPRVSGWRAGWTTSPWHNPQPLRLSGMWGVWIPGENHASCQLDPARNNPGCLHSSYADVQTSGGTISFGMKCDHSLTPGEMRISSQHMNPLGDPGEILRSSSGWCFTFTVKWLTAEVREYLAGILAKGTTIQLENAQNELKALMTPQYHGAPEPGCGCGFWAYWAGGSVSPISGTVLSPTLNVSGVIEGYGHVLKGPLGFRCEKARILALARRSSRPPLTVGNDELEALGRIYGVPVYLDQQEMMRAHPPDRAPAARSARDFG